jgi:NAD(P)H-nitrite reductase large subunit
MSEKHYDYLIIGNSTAAIAALETLRKLDATGTIAVVSDQRSHCYSSPLITYVLCGKVTEKNLFYRPLDFYEKLQADTYLGSAVSEMQPDRHEVTLSNGAVLGYGKLLLAVGGTPIQPDLPGADLEGVFTFTRYDDLCRVREFITAQKVRQAVVVGGGMIGVKVAEALATLGLETTMVELMDRVLAQALDETGSEMARRALEQAGVRVITGSAVTSIGGNDGVVQSVTLDSGSRLQAQMVVMAVGVRPNIRLAEQAGLSFNRGILVDDAMQTSDPDIYAAGDCVEAMDPLLGDRRPIAIWPSAYIQGEVAGANMAGTAASYEGNCAMNSIQVCGLPTISVGLTQPPAGAEVLEYRSLDGKAYRRIFIVEGRIVGAIFVGEIDRAGIITGLIRGQIPVESFREKLMQRDLGLLSLPKQYRKHIVMGPGIEV